MAVWGTLGAQSNFSSAGTVPPHYLLAAANVAGLDFAAIADPAEIPGLLSGTDPQIYVGDFQSALTYYQTQPFVDATRPAMTPG